MSVFADWLFDPGTKGKNFSLNKEISGTLLDESVTALQSQQERTQRVFELVSKKLGRKDLIESCLCGYDVCTLFITYIYRLFKSYVLHSQVEECINIAKSQQIQHLFKTRRSKHIVWFKLYSSLQDRVSVLKAADPKNKLLTDDELRLFSFDQAHDLACSGGLSSQRGTSSVSFSFDETGYAQYVTPGVETCKFSFQTAMHYLRKEAQIWESRRFRDWKVPLEKPEADSLINLQLDEIRAKYNLEEIPHKELFDFVAGLDQLKSRFDRLNKLGALFERYGIDKSAHSLQYILDELQVSRSMNLYKLRLLSGVNEISPELLQQFAETLAKDVSRDFSAFSREERELLENTQFIYFALKDHPEILDHLSNDDRKVFSEIFFIWTARHECGWDSFDQAGKQQSMNLIKLRQLSRAREISPELLARFAVALDTDLQNLQEFTKEEKILLQASQIIREELKKQPSLLHKLLGENQKVLTDLFNAWQAYHMRALLERIDDELMGMSETVDYPVETVDVAISDGSSFPVCKEWIKNLVHEEEKTLNHNYQFTFVKGDGQEVTVTTLEEFAIALSEIANLAFVQQLDVPAQQAFMRNLQAHLDMHFSPVIRGLADKITRGSDGTVGIVPDDKPTVIRIHSKDDSLELEVDFSQKRIDPIVKGLTSIPLDKMFRYSITPA